MMLSKIEMFFAFNCVVHNKSVNFIYMFWFIGLFFFFVLFYLNQFYIHTHKVRRRAEDKTQINDATQCEVK